MYFQQFFRQVAIQSENEWHENKNGNVEEQEKWEEGQNFDEKAKWSVDKVSPLFLRKEGKY